MTDDFFLPGCSAGPMAVNPLQTGRRATLASEFQIVVSYAILAWGSDEYALSGSNLLPGGRRVSFESWWVALFWCRSRMNLRYGAPICCASKVARAQQWDLPVVFADDYPFCILDKLPISSCREVFVQSSRFCWLVRRFNWRPLFLFLLRARLRCRWFRELYAILIWTNCLYFTQSRGYGHLFSIWINRNVKVVKVCGCWVQEVWEILNPSCFYFTRVPDDIPILFSTESSSPFETCPHLFHC